jgi:hypothetical protein
VDQNGAYTHSPDLVAVPPIAKKDRDLSLGTRFTPAKFGRIAKTDKPP